MKSIQGFVTKSSSVLNGVGQIADFFEISPIAQTYTRQKGEYQHLSYPGDVLHTFQSVDTATNLPYVLTEGQVAEILNVVELTAAYAASHFPPYDTQDFQAAVQAGMVGKVESLGLGPIKTGIDTSLPEWMSWTSLQFPDVDIKIWIANSAFEDQYRGFEIVTVAPVNTLDSFFGNYGEMVNYLVPVTASVLLERVQMAKNGYPDTFSRFMTFDYVNPNNTAQKTPVNWAVLIYGKTGDNVDSIKDAIVDFVLANSTKSKAQWEVIFPDLFRRTEFLFLPRWDKIAIANLTSISALYSSMADPMESLTYARTKWPSVSPAWVENNLKLIPFDYKCITLLSLTGENNIAAKGNLTTLFPDYLPIGTNSLDFNRMSVKTRNWVINMVELVKAAETVTDSSSIESPNRRVYRGGLLYVSRVYDDVNYMVAARSNFVV